MFSLLCLLILYLPFQIALNPVSGIDLASSRIFILCLFLIWIFWALKNKKFKIADNTITYFLLAFLFFSGLSMFAADDFSRSIRKILVFISIFPIYFLVVSVIDSKEKLDKFVDCMIFSATLAAIVGILQFILQFFIGIAPILNFWQRIGPVFYGKSFSAAIALHPSWLVNIGGNTYLRAFAFFPDPHMFSFYLGMVIPLVISKIKNQKSKYLGFLIILIAAQILTFSRGGYVGFGLFLLFYLFNFIFKNLRIENWKLKIKKVSFIVILFLGIVGLFFTQNPISTRIISIFDYKEGSNSGRIAIWKDSWDVSVNHFLLGVGIGNYSHYLYPAASYREPIYAHNTYLDILSEMGILGLASYFLLIFSTIWYLLINDKKFLLKNSKFQTLNSKQIQNSNNKILNSLEFNKLGFDDYLGFKIWDLKFGLAGSLIWFSGHAFFDTPIYSAQVLPLLIIILGLSSCIIYWQLE